MKKLYAERVLESDSNGGVFIYEVDPLLGKHGELYYTYDLDGRLVEIDLVVNDSFKLELTPEELLFVEEQIRIKEIESDNGDFKIKEIVSIDETYNPIIKKIKLKITEEDLKNEELLITVHMHRWSIFSVTASYYCSFKNQIETIELKFKEKKLKELHSYIIRNELKLTIHSKHPSSTTG